MNRRQKSALRSAHIKLADELILDEDFYAALRQNKIFTDSMIGLIKVTPLIINLLCTRVVKYSKLQYVNDVMQVILHFPALFFLYILCLRALLV